MQKIKEMAHLDLRQHLYLSSWEIKGLQVGITRKMARGSLHSC